MTGLDEIALSPFLELWPFKPFKMRMVFQKGLPVLSYFPELATDADAQAKRIVKMLEISAKHLAWGQTYSTEDFGETFLEKYG